MQLEAGQNVAAELVIKSSSAAGNNSPALILHPLTLLLQTHKLPAVEFFTYS